ncbi:protein kinase [bacterium]|nr:protein kinase [bacterium]
MVDRSIEDELVERLAEPQDSGQRQSDSTLAEIAAEIDTLAGSLRSPPVANPFAGEAELAEALSRVSQLARDSSKPSTLAEGPSAALETEFSQEILGQYQLLEKLGAGGMGTVYRAIHSKLKRVVAIKVLPVERFRSADAVARFEREMQAIGMLHHPNIIAAHDAGELDGRHFLVMEYVDGKDVSDLVSRMGPLPIPEACEIVRQAALGLQHIHEHGLVHRDLKPSNLMLTEPHSATEQPTVKILDLGLALLDSNLISTERELTSTGQVMGTVDYMAPEQGLDTHSVDIRADLYSLGATLYKLLTGRAPLEDPRYNSLMKRLIALDREEPPALSSLRTDCPPALEAIVRRLLSKSPEHRPELPQTLADQLEPFAAGADLRSLMKDATERSQQPAALSMQEVTTVTTPQSPTQIYESRKVARSKAVKPRPNRKLWALLMPIVLLLGVVIYVTTDNGTIIIEAPDDLKESVSVSVERNGNRAVETWSIRPGVNSHRIQTGNVDVHLPAEFGDAFELEPLGDLVVRRGKEVAYKLTRRASFSKDEQESATQLPVEPGQQPSVPTNSTTGDRFALEFQGKREFVEIPSIAYDGEPPLTLEAWVTPLRLDADAASVITVGGQESPLFKIKLQRRDWNALLGNSAATQFQFAADHAELGRRDHVAAVWTGKEIRIFKNGQERFPQTTQESLRNLRLGDGLRLAFESFGRIDEVRISKSARYREPFTPSERFSADDDTLALYHFDEGRGDLLTDSSGNGYHGRIVGAKWLTQNINSSGTPVTKPALDFNIDTPQSLPRIELSEPVPWNEPFTVEMFLSPQYTTSPYRQLLFGTKQNLSLSHWEQRLQWHLPESPANQPFLITDKVLEAGKRYHIAGVSTGKALQIYVNGELQGTKPTSPVWGAPPSMQTIGGFDVRGQGWHQLGGAIDEIRISTIARYTQPFSPPTLFAPDKDTFLLYYLSEGQGEQTADTSGHQRHGKIIGAKWGRVDLPAAQPVTPPDMTTASAPIDIDEPPPLEDWLIGRTILTVAQDGSGQFQTIQAALNALQPGQVVKVLDKGPYRERLDVTTPPDDTGLFCDQQTVIELPEWRYDMDPAPVGHIIRFPHGFRVHGFIMTAAELPTKPHIFSYGIQFNQSEQFVLEQCSFRFPVSEGFGTVVGAAWWNPASSTRMSVIRECEFNGSLMLNSLGEGNISITRNWFHGQNSAHINIADKHYNAVIIRENIFAGPPVAKDIILGLADSNSISELEISNNTMLSPALIDFGTYPPQGHVQVVNNLRRSPGLIKLSVETMQKLASTSEGWHIVHNSYPRQATLGEQVALTDGFYPSGATDLLVAPIFLTIDPSNQDYLRISADSPLATKGAGDGHAKYLGALPPGPSPKDGDWFTRLLQLSRVIEQP